jgi:DMSO/TMAO reductase YedYZ molybdopterin-dependent catalytic subunit
MISVTVAVDRNELEQTSITIESSAIQPWNGQQIAELVDRAHAAARALYVEQGAPPAIRITHPTPDLPDPRHPEYQGHHPHPL